MPFTYAEIARSVDHSLLHPTMTDAELREGCELARRYEVASVCIKPYAVPVARRLLEGSGVAVCTVIGFPHGGSHVAIKQQEMERACDEGATELDAVVNIGKVLSRDWSYLETEIGALTETAHRRRAIIKVIFENDFLPDDELKIQLCDLCKQFGADFAKTSTGYGFVKDSSEMYSYRGATDHDLKLMCERCLPEVQVKAAGGIRTLDDLLRVMEIGVTRVGATATEAILAAAKARGL